MESGSVAQVTPDRLMQFTGGYGPPLIIETALRLGIFDLLDGGAMDIGHLEAKTGSSLRGLRAALNALVGLDLLIKNDGGSYELTAESSAFLVRGKPTFHNAFFLLTSEAMVPHWGRLTEVVRSGRPTHRINLEEDGSAFFLRFVEDIYPIHLSGAQRLAEALKVGNANAPMAVLDLAAGSGVWSIAMAKQSPYVHVTAVDWPAVIAITRRVATREGVVDRFRFVEGDLHEADFGTGYTIATAGHILHSEGEQRSRALLEKTFAALAPGGLIAIAEILVDPDRRGPLPALMFALNMLVDSEHGDTFSLSEISSWLHDAGFDSVRTVDAPGLARQIIIATKPNR